jgi:hypothetical protein
MHGIVSIQLKKGKHFMNSKSIREKIVVPWFRSQQ